MKWTLIFIPLILSSSLALAKDKAIDDSSGGFVSTHSPSTLVSAIPDTPSHSWVIMTGKIEKHVRRDHYLFRDSSGAIEVDIDKKAWNGLTVSARDLVEIQGKVEHGISGTEIYVNQLIKR
ncbi:TPA: YgiW/YdeI family stress tolerance OB fold protein [Klebsiella oxytoca]|uniref:YgiW/YdeI family stress tolerance OB fold protein n=1 Tax=Klebsiella oxytoca TaxID=571 RepID=UPI00024FE6D2|nr:NirD/YgiW/YdeI family stress tolerance protein [Klebsiella oxytoca]EHT00595.1 TIGR00156 family protein [Klebsiella oxytoca 10-5245]HAT3720643.1 NirD/YgiW/YdeI family stress tolerance protein [Klebsiella oxytoca]HBL6845249.1 NirD/YgiW/YdeI family stress tolerance protein [Klebsiella oxytoca]HBM3153831.1 NirD/YgiW/YdeI family stress tolerance protein [Klebsiella oxytoca]HCJ0415083.1 NirD/YgiW/YdeI family stress tolerance protein [Klebsiella oxytoca]